MIKQRFLGFLLIFLIQFVGIAGAEIRPFLESWNNIAYYDTNNEQKNFSSLLGHIEGKLGLYLFDTPVQLYGAYYCTASQSPNYWDNSS